MRPGFVAGARDGAPERQALVPDPLDPVPYSGHGVRSIRPYFLPIKRAARRGCRAAQISRNPAPPQAGFRDSASAENRCNDVGAREKIVPSETRVRSGIAPMSRFSAENPGHSTAVLLIHSMDSNPTRLNKKRKIAFLPPSTGDRLLLSSLVVSFAGVEKPVQHRGKFWKHQPLMKIRRRSFFLFWKPCPGA